MAFPHPRRECRGGAQGGPGPVAQASGQRLSGSGRRQVKKLFVSLALTLLVPALCLFAPVAAHAANIRNIDLGRAAQVWFAEDHTVPIIAFNISLPAGSAYDPAGQAGLATFFPPPMVVGARGPGFHASHQTTAKTVTSLP